MLQILIYIMIIFTGFILSRKNIISKRIISKTAKFQTYSLFFLLGVMGYKIGSDDKILSNLHTIGIESFITAALAILCSIGLTFIVFKILGKKETK